MEDNLKDSGKKIKTRESSGYLRQLYSTARSTAGSTHSNLKNLTTFLVNFVPVEKVDTSELQVRSYFDQNEIDALSKSIKDHGVLQPILVVQDGDRYKVIAGERRLRASKQAGMDRIPARVITSDDKAVHEIALRENLDRVDLHPIEEGEAYLSLLEAGAYSTYEGIASAFLKSKSRITECIGFTRLPENTKAELLKNGLKSRSLLRKLSNSDESLHAQMISLSLRTEQEEAGMNKDDTSQKTKVGKKDLPSFSYFCSSEKISVPAYKWKQSDGPAKLTEYVLVLEGLLADLRKITG